MTSRWLGTACAILLLAGCKQQAAFRVVPGALTITPNSGAFFIGQSVVVQAYTAITNNTTQAVPASEIKWSSSNPAALSIAQDGTLTAIAAATGVTIQASWSGVVGTGSFNVENAQLMGLLLEPDRVFLTPNGTQAMQVIGQLSDGSTTDLTQGALGTEYVTSDPSVATISLDGVVTAVAVGGPISITATNNGQSAAASVTVTAQQVSLSSIVLTPGFQTLSTGTMGSVQLSADYSDGESVDITADPAVQWFTSDSSALTVGPNGALQALAASPSAVVSATYQAERAAAIVEVVSSVLTSISVAPAELTLPLNGTAQLTVIGTFADGHTQDLTDDPTLFVQSAAPQTVSTDGALLTGIASGGPVQITLTIDGESANVEVTVLNASLIGLIISPSSGDVPLRGTLQLVVTGQLSDGSQTDLSAASTGTTYAVSSEGELSVDADGLVSGLQVGGPVAITATNGSLQAQAEIAVAAGSTQIVSLTIIPASASVNLNAALQLQVIATYGDGQTADVTSPTTGTVYSTSNPSLLSVGPKGLVMGLAYGGPVLVTAGNSGAVATASIEVAPPGPALNNLTVTPTPVSGNAGATVQLSVIGNYNNGTGQDLTQASTGTVYSISGNPAVASVSPNGLISLLSAGNCAVVVSNGGAQAAVPVTVTPETLIALTVAPNALEMPTGMLEQLTVTGIFSSGATADLTASSTGTVYSATGTFNFRPTPTPCSVSPDGLVTAAGTDGRGAILVQNSGLSATVRVTVTTATITQVAASAMPTSIPAGLTTQATCTASTSTGGLLDVTDASTGTQWVSGNPGVLSVSGNGLITGIGAGTATATCLNSGQAAPVSITVTPAVAESVTVSPAATLLPLGQPLALSVTAQYTDGTTQDASSAADGTVYISSNNSVATVTSDGVVVGLKVGATATITVLVAGETQTCVITIVPAALESLAFSPPQLSVTAGSMLTLDITGTYSDGTMSQVTPADGLVFTTGNSSTATVNAAGVVSGVASGQTTVYAYAAGLVAQAALTVQ